MAALDLGTPAESRVIRAWDGLALHVQTWAPPGPPELPPLLCLPGLVRTGADFAAFAAAHGAGRLVVTLDYAGRGRSGRSRDVARYGPEACLRDVLDVCAALHLHRVVAVGTSFGGLLAMGLAAARPGLLDGAVINDIGPEIGAAGEAFIRAFVADDPALPDLPAAAAHLRRLLPYMSFTSEADWQVFARLTYEQGPDGKWHPRWDRRIAHLLHAPVRPLWPLFGALDGIRLLLVHGLTSTLLLPATVLRMQALRPDMAVVGLPGVGHAPTLAEPQAALALAAFLAEPHTAQAAFHK